MKQWYQVTNNETFQAFKNSCKWIEAGMGTLASSIQFKDTGEICSLCYDTIEQKIFILREVQ